MNGLGISISSLGLQSLGGLRPQLLDSLFSLSPSERDLRIEADLSVLSHLSRDSSSTQSLLNLFRPLDATSSGIGEYSLRDLAAQALKLFDVTSRSSLERDSSFYSDPSRLYASQLSNPNLLTSSFYTSSTPAIDSISGVSSAIASGSSLSQIGEFLLPNAIPISRPDLQQASQQQTIQQQRGQVPMPQRSAQPFEALRRPYEKGSSYAEKSKKKEDSTGASGSSLLHAVKQTILRFIMPASAY